MFAFLLSARIFQNFLSSKDFSYGDCLQNFPVLKDFTVEIVFEKLTGFDFDYIYIALDCSPSQGKDHGVSSLDKHFFALRANVGIKYF